MTTPDLLDLALRASGVSLATYALIGQVVKPALRMLAKRHAGASRLTRAQEDFYRWLARTMCIVVGALLGMLPLWPEWMTQLWWGLLIGAIAGSMAPGIHRVVSRALPERIGRMISGGTLRSD
tara:strand:+ start:5661 stop:6029 length:369 start_codon:yes stop_codon:yes gene_type:complete